MDSFDRRMMEEVTVPLDTFESWGNFSVKQFLSSTCRMSSEFRGVVSEFIGQVQKDGYVLNYETIPEVSDVEGNYRNRFLIVHVDGDYVLCLFKLVDPPKIGIERHWSMYPPISLEGSFQHELLVLKSLSVIPCLDRVTVYLDKRVSEYVSNNYYTDRAQYELSLSKNKKKIRKAKELSEVIRVQDRDVCDDSVISNILMLDDMWKKNKPSMPCSPLFDKKMALMSNKMDTLDIMTFWYQDKMVGYQMLIQGMGNYITLYSRKTICALSHEGISEYLGCDMDTSEFIRRWLGKFIDWYTLDHFLVEEGLDAVYRLGDCKKKGLREAKKFLFPKCIFYYRVPLLEYIQEVERFGTFDMERRASRI